jgi:hypothetical protein
MSKTPVNFSFKEALTSGEHNAQTIDYLTSGESFCHATTLLYSATGPRPITVGWHPYNPNKSVWNRLRMLGGVEVTGIPVPLPPMPEYSLDSGVTWTAVAPAVGGLPIDVGRGGSPPTFPFDTTVNLEVGAGGPVVFEFIGIRWPRITGGVGFTIDWMLTSFFYNSAFNPF